MRSFLVTLDEIYLKNKKFILFDKLPNFRHPFSATRTLRMKHFFERFLKLFHPTPGCLRVFNFLGRILIHYRLQHIDTKLGENSRGVFSSRAAKTRRSHC